MGVRSTSRLGLVCAALAPFPLLGLGYFGADPQASTFAQFQQRLFVNSSAHARNLTPASQAAGGLPAEVEALFASSDKGPRADRYLELKTTQSVPRRPRVQFASLAGLGSDVTGALPADSIAADAINREAKAELLMTPTTFGHVDAARFLNEVTSDVLRQAEEEEKERLKQEIAALLTPRVPRTLTYQGETQAEYEERQRRCLATAIYFEARGEPREGQLAVAQVVMNRVRSPDWPDTICGVVFQGQWNRNGCQFSFACDGQPDKPKDMVKWDEAMRLAREVTDGKVFLDDIGHATHYHATYVKPRWVRDMNLVERIGQHIFYRQRGEKPYVVEQPDASASPERGLALAGSG